MYPVQINTANHPEKVCASSANVKLARHFIGERNQKSGVFFQGVAGENKSENDAMTMKEQVRIRRTIWCWAVSEALLVAVLLWLLTGGAT